MCVVEDIILIASELRDAVVQDLYLLQVPVRQGNVLLAERESVQFIVLSRQVIMTPCNVLKLQPLRNVEREGDEETRENEGHHVEHGRVTEK